MSSSPIRTLKNVALSLLHHLYFLCAKPLPLEKDAGSCLVIAPHPDDETLGCGAAILRARKIGLPVSLIVVTDGSRSSRSSVITPQELTALRKAETGEACGLLGLTVNDIVFLPFIDGMANENIPDIAGELHKHITRVKPRVIFSPYVDGHEDHCAVAAAIDLLVSANKIDAAVYEYPIWFWPWSALKHLAKPRELLRLRRLSTEGLLDLKRAALSAYRSQRVNLTGEKDWWTLEEKVLRNFFLPYEIFFEKRRVNNP